MITKLGMEVCAGFHPYIKNRDDLINYYANDLGYSPEVANDEINEFGEHGLINDYNNDILRSNLVKHYGVTDPVALMSRYPDLEKRMVSGKDINGVEYVPESGAAGAGMGAVLGGLGAGYPALILKRHGPSRIPAIATAAGAGLGAIAGYLRTKKVNAQAQKDYQKIKERY